ncbi:MAG TPA: hypothetical protein VED67_03690 [Thermodesulfovibrionales bacterium]|nr:hypothetical protein [Thermodesulfovibrionales bacterium]
MLNNASSSLTRRRMRIVPSLLAEKFDAFIALMEQAEVFADCVQVDVMDGIFVETRSFPVERINNVRTTLFFEVHLMVQDPFSFMSRISHPGLKKVIFQSEAPAEPLALINKITERGLVPGLAIKPETGIDEFRAAGEHADTLLFLTVDPGSYGHPFRPEVLTKVSEARKAFPDKVIAVDGGVSLDNLKMFYDVGVDYVCIGSRIFLQDDPGKSYRNFIEKVKEIEKG